MTFLLGAQAVCQPCIYSVPFVIASVRDWAGRRGLSISPSKPPCAKPEKHTAKPFWHRPWCLCKEQISACREAAGRTARHMLPTEPPSLSPSPHSPQQNHSQIKLAKMTLFFTPKSSSLEESGLKKLDHIAKLQSFSVYIYAYGYGFSSLGKKTNTLITELEDWEKNYTFHLCLTRILYD